MENKDNLAIVEAIKVLDKLLKKYGYNNINAGNLNVLLQEGVKHGKIWYGAFVEKCRIPEEKLNYPTGRREYDALEQIEQEQEPYISNLENDYSFVCVMAAAKTISDRMAIKATAYSSRISELAEEQSKLETYCESVLESFKEAGVSELILNDFAKSQNSRYADTLEELIGIEEDLHKLDKKNVILISDKNKIDSAINAIEANTYLKYIDPDDNTTYIRHKYQSNILKVQEKQDSKIKV